MRRLLDIIGGLFVALGIICVLGSSMAPPANPGFVDSVLGTGMVMILAGWVFCNLAARKTGPRCRRLVKFKGLK